MKKLVYVLTVFLLFTSFAEAQHCSTISNNVAPLQASGTPGFTPDFRSLPCLDSGWSVVDTIYFENYATILDSIGNPLTINTLKIDSISNLPTGICWTTNTTNNTFSGGQTGVIIFSGASSHPHLGQYKLRFMVDINAGPGGTVNLRNVDAETLSPYLVTPLRYYMRVKRNPRDSCASIDTSAGGVHVAFTTNITATGLPVICNGAPVTLSADYCQSCSYLWSTGATNRSISATGAGPYSVTATNGVDTASAGPYAVRVDAPLVSSFLLIADTTQINTWSVVDQSIGTGIYSRGWNWGDGGGYSDSSLTHTYTLQGNYRVCERVYDSAGCMVQSCDSLGNVNIPLPSNPTISVHGVICNSTPTTLSTNLCTGCTYLWSNGDTTRSIHVNVSMPYSVTITQGGNSVSAVSGTIRRDSMITPTFALVADTSISNKFYATLTSSSAGIYYYTWIWGDGNMDHDSLPTTSHTYINSGNYNVCLMAHDTAGCEVQGCDSTGAVFITLPSQPVISGVRTLCNGNSGWLRTSLCTGCSYLWSTGDTTTGISVSTAGPYTVTITQGGHSASSVPYLITIDTVTAGFSLVRDTAAAHHWFVVNQCHGAGNLYYLWSWGDGGHDSSATPTHTYSSAGNYNICVEVYDRNGCNDRYCDSSTYIYRSQAIISVLVLPVAAAGINDVSAASHVRVYPNPTTGTLSIEVPAASQGSAHIFDALGRWMRDLSLSSVKTTTDVSDLPDGVYTIVVKAGSENYNVRFVKTR